MLAHIFKGCLVRVSSLSGAKAVRQRPRLAGTRQYILIVKIRHTGQISQVLVSFECSRLVALVQPPTTRLYKCSHL